MDKQLPADELSAEEQAYFDQAGQIEDESPAETPEPSADAPEEDAAPEPEQDGAPPEDEDGGDRRRNRTVDYRALREAREELSRERQERAKLEERVNIILQHMQGQQQPQQEEASAEPEPLEPFDPDKHDVFDYLKRQSEEIAQLRGWKQETERERAERMQRERQAAAVQDFQQRLAAHEQSFAQQNPDYFDRLEAYSTQEAQRRAVLSGYGGDPRAVQQVAQQVKSELFRTAYNLVRQGQDPAAYFYQALANYAPAPAQETEPEPAKEEPPPEDKFQSLKGSGSSKARKVRTPADLAKMSDDEFQKAIENGTFARVMGG